MLKDERRDAAKDYLFEAILSLETIEDCYNFFEDLCTIKELEEMAKRMCGAKMLDTCKVYTEISDNTGLSTATISPHKPLSQIRQRRLPRDYQTSRQAWNQTARRRL